jgi:hypothetical protein
MDRLFVSHVIRDPWESAAFDSKDWLNVGASQPWTLSGWPIHVSVTKSSDLEGVVSLRYAKFPNSFLALPILWTQSLHRVISAQRCHAQRGPIAGLASILSIQGRSCMYIRLEP